MAKIPTIKELELGGKRVLMRVDFNVPLTNSLKVADDTRINAALPTIRYTLNRKAKLILMSHLGRPKGKVNDSLRMDPVAKKLSELLGRSVKKMDNCIGNDVKKAVDAMKEGDIILLENLRFHPEEKDNNPEFAKQLASLGEVYINDAFGTAHRAHASTEGITKYLDSVAAGFLLEKEVEYLGGALESPAKPFAAILGGAKVSDKIAVIENLLEKVNALIIGGGMAYTFLKAQGKQIGSSKLEQDKIDIAADLINKAKDANVRLELPVDHVITDNIETKTNIKHVQEDIPDGYLGVDIGPDTVENFKFCLKDAKTIIWNGPLGIFEIDEFSEGTRQIAQFIASMDAVKIIGGGDTAAAIAKLELKDKMSHVSTGGGASLEFLEGKALPGIAALAK